MPDIAPNSSTSAGSAFRRSEGVVLRKTAGEALLIPVRGRIADLQHLFILDEVGEVIWGELSQPRTPDQLAGAIRTRFSGVDDDVSTHCREFLEDLAAEGLVCRA